MFVCPECGATAGAAGACPADGAAFAARADDPMLGTTLGPYRVARLLGVGGMGRVYKGVNPAIGSRVAIKVLARECADKPDVVERFFAEARAINVIRHESIVNVIDLAVLPDGRPYIVMEFLAGAALADVLTARGALPLGGAVRLVAEVLSALTAAHDKGIVHRDLKPDNIFVTPQGRVKVLDFGIAKLQPELSGAAGPTRTGSLLGTPHYMSPEQALGQHVDARTDLYAVGVILFEAVCGQRPFHAESLFQLLRKQVDEAPPRPSALRRDLPPELEQVILRALEKDPARRFSSAVEMAQALGWATQALPAEAWAPVLPGDGAAGLAIGPTHLPTPSGKAGATPSTPGFAHAPWTAAGPVPGTPAPAVAVARPARTGAVLAVLGGVAALGVGVAFALSGSTATPTASPDGGMAAAAADAAPELPPIAAEAVAPPPANPGAAPGASNPPAAGADPATVIAAAQDAARHAGVDVSAALQTGRIAGAGFRGAAVDAGVPSRSPPALDAAPAAAPAEATAGADAPSAGRWAHFDVSGYLGPAQRHARVAYDDAVLVRLDADGVRPDGRADLTLDGGFTVLYRYNSPSRAVRPKDLPLGVAFKPDCKFYVPVNREGVSPYPLHGWKCDEQPIHPRCTLAQVWKRAIAQGAPRDNAVAAIGIWANGKDAPRWSFEIKGTFSATIGDDC